MESIILDYIRTLIWPFLVGLALFFFRDNIKGFLNRLTRAKFPGGELETERIQIETQEEVVQEARSAEIALRTQGELLEMTRKYYENEIKKYETENQTNKEIINQLIRQLTEKALQIEFEKIYRIIFGSQIFLLKHLLTKKEVGESRLFMELYFEQTKKNWSPNFDNWRVDNYLAFLLSQGLVNYEGSNNSYHITDLGEAFINYITTAQYLDNKGL